MMRLPLLLVVLGMVAGPVSAETVREIHYLSAADGTQQPAMFFNPQRDEKVPLIVVLHTWSGDYRQKHHQAIEDWCVEKGWAYIHPNFRGPNRRPEATGSDLVVQDIASAVAFALKEAGADPRRVYLAGTSGGGYTALLMAGRHPELWAGVLAWVPISDLAAWHAQGRYVKDLVASCGGAPGDSPTVDEQYRKRSPLTYLANAKGVTLHIHAGIHDGHTGSVPVSHSLNAFNKLAEPADRLSLEEIQHFVEKREVPPHLRREINDPSYGMKRPLFRRTSGSATVTIFEGGHELVPPAAIAWFEGLAK